jgi:CBS-domain-containing membrane protein
MASATPAGAVAYALGAGAYVPEWSQGQELLEYLAKLEGHNYAVVDQNGRVTGLLRQSTVVMAITGKVSRENKRPQGQNR